MTSFALDSLDEPVGAPAPGREDVARHGEYLPVLLEGVVGREERAALLAGLYDDGAERHPAHDAVAPGEVLRVRSGAEWVLGDQDAVLHYLGGQRGVLPRIDDVDAAAEDGDRALSRFEGRPVGDAVDAARQSADDGHAGLCQIVGEHPRRLSAVGGRLPGADDGDEALLLGWRLALDVEDGAGGHISP